MVLRSDNDLSQRLCFNCESQRHKKTKVSFRICLGSYRLWIREKKKRKTRAASFAGLFNLTLNHIHTARKSHMLSADSWSLATQPVLREEKIGPDGSILKKVLKEGKGTPPSASNIVKRYVIPVVDYTVASMKEGERCIVECGPEYGYQSAGSPPKVPSNESLSFEIELITYERKLKHAIDMTLEEKMSTAAELREEGNNLHRAGEFSKAVDRYTKALDILSKLEDADAEQEAKASDMKLSLHLNLSAGHLKLKDYTEAVKYCELVLKEEPTNVKAIFRRGQAYVGRCEFEAAKNDFITAQKHAPNDKSIAQALKQLPAQEADYEKAQKQIYRNIFSK